MSLLVFCDFVLSFREAQGSLHSPVITGLLPHRRVGRLHSKSHYVVTALKETTVSLVKVKGSFYFLVRIQYLPVFEQFK